ncbi:hypothetical protein [Bradyrhizobium centrolobii]|uniref:hypothetical protein n=1 Tax=Bradyrhizobium centrolobii TaxID=1505087 RepID=UPI000AF094CB|nr:hypothetical protein [Bradyrhizobium centrolobii]
MIAFRRAAHQPALAFALALSLAASPALSASGPPPGFTLTDNADLAFTSPDSVTKLEQYMKETPDDFDVKWQAWARHGEQMTELKPEQGYPAGFRFTNDSQWPVRMQKTGSGEQDLYLYHLEKGAFVSATRKSLGDLAWAYFYSRPDASGYPRWLAPTKISKTTPCKVGPQGGVAKRNPPYRTVFPPIHATNTLIPLRFMFP